MRSKHLNGLLLKVLLPGIFVEEGVSTGRGTWFDLLELKTVVAAPLVTERSWVQVLRGMTLFSFSHYPLSDARKGCHL